MDNNIKYDSTADSLRDDELKNMWKDMNRRLERLETQIEDEGRLVSRKDMRTTQQTLAGRYKRFMVLGACMAIVFPLMILQPRFMDVKDMTWHIVAAILFFIYYVTASFFDGYLRDGVVSINLASTPTDIVAREMRRLKKIHHRSMMILFPMAVVVLGYFIYPFLHQEFVLLGVAVGGTVGLLLGLRVYFKMMAEYRELMQEYS